MVGRCTDINMCFYFKQRSISCIFVTFPDSKVAGNADILLQKRFHDLGLGTEAFSSVQYVGTQTIAPPTDYTRLLEAVRQQVKNTHTRSPRQPGIVFQALEVSGRFYVLRVNLTDIEIFLTFCSFCVLFYSLRP